MKKNIFVTLGILCIALVISSCNSGSEQKTDQTDSTKTVSTPATNAVDYSGIYTITDKKVCDLTIEIQKNGDKFTYVSGKTKGNIEVLKDENEVYLKLIAINGVSPKGDVEAKYENQTLIIQNEGNAMNEYTNFKQCDAKYLELKKVK